MPTRGLQEMPAGYPPRSMPLLLRRTLIGSQNLVNEVLHRPQARTASNRLLTLRRRRARQSLPNHPPMNTQLLRHSLNRPRPMPVLPSDLLKQLHLRSPVHRPPCRLRRQGIRLVSQGGPNQTSTSGPIQSSEITAQKVPP